MSTDCNAAYIREVDQTATNAHDQAASAQETVHAAATASRLAQMTANHARSVSDGLDAAAKRLLFEVTVAEDHGRFGFWDAALPDPDRPDWTNSWAGFGRWTRRPTSRSKATLTRPTSCSSALTTSRRKYVKKARLSHPGHSPTSRLGKNSGYGPSAASWSTHSTPTNGTSPRPLVNSVS